MSRPQYALFGLVLVGGLVLGGCPKKKKDTPGSSGNSAEPMTMGDGMTGMEGLTGMNDMPAPKKQCRPDEFMRIPKLSHQTDSDRTCAKDSDCVVSSLPVGTCCHHGCNRRWVYTRVFFDRLRKHRDTCCKGVKLDCDVWRCPQAEFRTVARCKDQKCVGERKPIKWKK